MTMTKTTETRKPAKPAKTIEELQAAHTAALAAYDASAAEADRIRRDPSATREQRRAAHERSWDLSRRIRYASGALTRARHAADPSYQRAERKVTVATPYGTYARTTSNNYSHVVLYCVSADWQRQRAERDLARARAGLAAAQAEAQAPCAMSASNGTRMIAVWQAEIAKQEAALSAGYVDIWVCFRWSHSLRAALGGKAEIQRYEFHRAVICEVATGKVVA
jgi:hypothetical protein